MRTWMVVVRIDLKNYNIFIDWPKIYRNDLTKFIQLIPTLLTQGFDDDDEA